MIVIVGAASPRHQAQMEKLAKFVNSGHMHIEYVNHGDSEDYILTDENAQILKLRICHNRVDGAFLVVS